ncbi:MAG: ATP-binding protein [Acetobacter sp.]|nr:ATP-binding protein [Bacteroides sp.]MCM1340957.1 ATP-binding protein [Acetobacter sp.]MCM1432487.1 ATP-binding protein [Clostridiales bacterium]
MKENQKSTIEKSINNLNVFLDYEPHKDKDKMEKVQGILENMNLGTLEESNIKINDLIDDLTDISSYSLPLEDIAYKTNLAIKRLGKEKNDEKNKAQTEKPLVKMARILSAYEEDFAISVISSNNNGRPSMNFIVSTNDESNSNIEAMVNGGYGRVEVQNFNDFPDFTIKPIYAIGKFVNRDKRDIKHVSEKDYSKFESWTSSILSSMPEDKNYCVKIRFSPIEDNSEIERIYESLNGFYKKVKFYSEFSWGNSQTTGVAKNLRESKGKEFSDAVKKWITSLYKHSFNYSSAYSLSSKDINKKFAIIADEIEYEMLRLERGINSKLWNVCISVEANDENTLQSLTSILSGVLQNANLKLDWSLEPRNALVGSTVEILSLMFFPTKEFPGFEFVENEEFSLVSPANINDGFEIGKILWNGKNIDDFYFSKNALNRHGFICGMTGAGKTNTLFNIIEHIDMPFLVIEPVKGEYRSLQSSYSDMNIYVMKTGFGNSNAELLRVNPFWFPENANLAFHIDSIKTILASAFELTAAMPNILEQCLYNIYIKSGWDLVSNKNRYAGKLPEEFFYPTFNDLCNEIEFYLNNSDFGAETLGDYKGALLTRLRSFINGFKGILLNTNEHPDYEKLMSGRSVIELEGLADDADKCLVMGTIIVQYYEYLKLNFKDNDKQNSLKHLIVIEEAHRLFKNVKKNNNQETADPAGQLVETLSNIMAEIRAFGEGILVVDQSPTKIAEDVIKNSGTKIIHRMDNEKDIKILQSSLLLNNDLTSIPSLKQGEALIRTEGMLKPCKVKIFRSDVKEAYSLSYSFNTSSIKIENVENIFAAASIFSNEFLRYEVQNSIIDYLNWFDEFKETNDWYEITYQFIIVLIYIIDYYQMTDYLNNKADVLFNLVYLVIKNMCLSKKDIGYLLMLFRKTFDFYLYSKNGGFIKKGAIELLKKYWLYNIKHILEEQLQENL